MINMGTDISALSKARTRYWINRLTLELRDTDDFINEGLTGDLLVLATAYREGLASQIEDLECQLDEDEGDDS